MVLFPNPVTGPTVNLLPPAYPGTGEVRVEIFTIAFRKVLDKPFPDLPAGTAVTIPLNDSWGDPLANGLYYIVVDVGAEHSVGKLLILR